MTREADGGLASTSYCTTSGIVDSNGITVGNVNLGGDTSSPVVAVVALDPRSAHQHGPRARRRDI